MKNNSEVRELLGKSGIQPEKLPAEEDIKKMERRVKLANNEISNEKLSSSIKKKK